MPKDDQDDRDAGRNTPTMTAPPPSDVETNPEASVRPAVPPPAQVPDDYGLGSSQLAAREPPQWFKDSFIGAALSSFARDAEDIRKGREAQHREQMLKLDKVVADMGALAREMSLNYEMLAGEFRRHRDASDARAAEQAGRIHEIEKALDEIKVTMRRDAEKRLADVERITQLEQLIEELKRNGPRPSSPAASG